LQTPTTEGGAAGMVANLEDQLVEFYAVRGWNKDGIPTKEKLAELGLEFAINDLH
jgi:aldehyde:ferredoxin oxidoreductase